MALSDIGIDIDTDPASTLRLMDQIDLLTMSPRRRRLLMRKVGKGVIKDARLNIKKQQTVAGTAMKPRKKNRVRRKLLSKMGKGLMTKFPAGDREGIVTWKNPGHAIVASRHQHGVPESFGSIKAKKMYGTPDYKKPATPRQAASLIKEGYRARVARKRGKGKAVLKRVSKKWIQDNLTLGQAGLILRLLRTGETKGPQRWTIKVPERPFLGVTPKQANVYLTAMARAALQELRKA
ncbi:MAG: hypothetical protein K9K40_14695 [Desulfotignum sp.]|nr:hypothetical protein [Desulfotignum sp.]